MLFFSISALANQPWELDPRLGISELAAANLKERYPVISGPQDLSKILVSAGLKVPTTALFAELENGRWMIRGQQAPTVEAVHFNSAPISLLPKLRILASNWIGLVHTDVLQIKIERDIEDFLIKRGYPEAKVSSTMKIDDLKVEYSMNLDIGSPCIIRGFKWPEALPKGFYPKLDLGELCDDSLVIANLEEISKKLHESGWTQSSLAFENFDFSSNRTSALAVVKGTFGENIEYQFIDQATNKIGSYLLTSEELQLLNPRQTSPDAVTYELMTQLKTRGYIDAQVTGPEVSHLNGVAVHKFTVNRGAQYNMVGLKFEGNEFFLEGTLSGYIKTDFVATKVNDEDNFPPYNPIAVAEGMDEIRTLYTKAGFWDVRVNDRVSQSTTSEKKRMQVVIAIEEGRRRIFDKIVFAGNQNLDDESLEELWEIDQGDAFDRADIVSYQQAVRSLYSSKGYYHATVTVDLKGVQTSSNEIPIVAEIKIDEGPRVKFGDVFVTGLVKAEQKVVIRELLFETGDWYDPELIKASRRALLRIGVFSSVTITPLDPAAVADKAEMLDWIIDVREAPSRTVSFGPGWSSFYGMRYNLEGSLTNLGGTGRQLYSRGSFNQEKSQNAIGNKTLIGRSIGVGYLEPHIFDSPIDGNVSLSQAAFSTDYAWSLTRGGEIELSHTLRSLLPGSRIGLFYGRKLNEEESENFVKDAFLSDTFSSGRFGLRFIIDHRDDISWPTSGYTINSEVAMARYEFGGDLRYTRWEVGNNHYFGIFDNLVFAVGFNLSAYQSVKRKNDNDFDILPASERLSSGGADSVRGFRERSLGPIVRRPNITEGNTWNCDFTDSPTGGSRRILIKTELRYKWTDSIATSTFIDSGNSSFTNEEEIKFRNAFNDPNSVAKSVGCNKDPVLSIEDNIGYELSELVAHPGYLWTKNYSSYGLALNFLTPIGSINLAYGVPWYEPKSTRCENDDTQCISRIRINRLTKIKGEIHFNVGAKF